MTNFRKLEVWRMSIIMSTQILQFSRNMDRIWQYSLGDQIRKCALSIPSNIAEGAGRSNKSFAHFLDIAIGSSFELETQLILLCRMHLIENDEFERLSNNLQSIQKMLNVLRRRIRSSLNDQGPRTNDQKP